MSRGFFFSPLPRSPSNSTDFNASASECASVRLRLRSFKEFSPSPIPQVWLEKEGPWRGQRWVSEGTPLPPELRVWILPRKPGSFSRQTAPLPAIPWPLKLEKQSLISFRESLGNEWRSQQRASIAGSWSPPQAAAPAPALSSLLHSSFSSFCPIFLRPL